VAPPLTPEWEFAYALPNLALDADRDPGDFLEWRSGISLGTRSLMIAGGDDAIVVELRQRRPAIDRILSSFRDETGDAFVPAVLLERRASLSEQQPIEPVMAFRNAVALSFVLRGATAAGAGRFTPSFSDTFDLHPAQMNAFGHPVIASPAILHMLTEDDPLNFGPSPYSSVYRGKLYGDHYLLRSLSAEWKRKYVRHRGGIYGRALFRSLEMAYQASSLGARASRSLIDYGVQIALWISAMEVLAWPTMRRVSLSAVIELLKGAHLTGALARRRFPFQFGRKDKKGRKTGPWKSLNTLERAYTLLYDARNRTLHGDPVAIGTLVRVAAGKRVALPQVAALVYRAALTAYLRPRHPRQLNSLHAVLEITEEDGYQKALANLFKMDAETAAPLTPWAEPA
jgi:hypothetical protein